MEAVEDCDGILLVDGMVEDECDEHCLTKLLRLADRAVVDKDRLDGTW